MQRNVTGNTLNHIHQLTAKARYAPSSLLSAALLLLVCQAGSVGAATNEPDPGMNGSILLATSNNSESLSTKTKHSGVYKTGRTFSDKLKDGGKGPLMVIVPAGSFDMGDSSQDKSADADENPLHKVTFRKSFAIGVYEVTQADYDHFLIATKQKRESERCDESGHAIVRRDRWENFPEKDYRKYLKQSGQEMLDEYTDGQERSLPVGGINRQEALAYAFWLSRQTGKRYRLPSEAEWEYAARAGTRTRYWWGDEVGINQANCDGCGNRWGRTRLLPVGSFKANAFGLYDVLGNVAEWTADCAHKSYQGAPMDGSVWGAADEGDCGKSVLRGGHAGSTVEWIRTANRFPHDAYRHEPYTGLRLVRELD